MARLLFAALLVLIMPCAAHAADNGDMFAKDGLDTSNRPSMPSDPNSGNAGADIFQAPATAHTGNDVFHNSPPPNPGVEDEFSAHNNQPVPYGPLFGPKNAPPP